MPKARELQGEVVGFVVKVKSEEHPRGHTVSRVYHAKSAAEDLAAILSREAPPGTRYWVTDKTRVL